jgi:hypothetical protein
MLPVLIVIVALVCVFIPTGAMATPDLTLSIDPSDGGYYDLGTETWLTGQSDFTLLATVDDEDVFRGEDTAEIILCVGLHESLYYLDYDANGDPIVIFEPGTTLTIDGVSYTADDFTYGLPPISEMNPDGGGGDLPPHDVYPTAFLEVKRTIDDPGVYEFEIEDGVAGTHFDLYTITSNPGEIDKFAPFSKDAGIVPEPSTLVLLGTSLLLVSAQKRRKRKRLEP